MEKFTKLSAIFTLVMIVAMAPMKLASQDIEIQVSPNVLNLQSNGTVVTIHTDIAYWTVDASTVLLNGVVIQSWKSDNQGNFVAKFNMDEIKGLPELVIGEYNTLTLEGTTNNSGSFTGSEDVLVINNLPKGKK